MPTTVSSSPKIKIEEVEEEKEVEESSQIKEEHSALEETIKLAFSGNLTFEECAIKLTNYFFTEEKLVYKQITIPNEKTTFTKLVNGYVYLDDLINNQYNVIDELKDRYKLTTNLDSKNKLLKELEEKETSLEDNSQLLAGIENKLRLFCQKKNIPLENDYTYLDEKYGIELTKFVELFSPYVEDTEQVIYQKLESIIDSSPDINVKMLIDDGLRLVMTENSYTHIVVFLTKYKLAKNNEIREFILDMQPKYHASFERFVLEHNILNEEDIKELFYSS